MPPKPRFTREEITEAAYKIASVKGIDAVMAREVGKALGSTARPIFTVFTGMDELKEAVRALAQKRCLEYLSGAFEYAPAFKEFGMRWVRYALEQPHLFSLVFSDAGSPAEIKEIFGPLTERVISSAVSEYSLTPEHAKALMDRMTVFSTGIATFALRGGEKLSETEVAKAYSEVGIGMVIRFQILEGTFQPASFQPMLDQPEFIPTRINP